jgi:hypothetical protein
MFYYLLIVNKNGSLIYDRSLNASLNLSQNETINIASIFYSMHAISAQLTPPGYEKTSDLKLENHGIEILESSSMKLVCHQTLTKIKFIFVTDISTPNSNIKLKFEELYNNYTDLISKNPFYELDMPIRIDAFDEAVSKIFK